MPLRLDELETPVLTADLDAVERNIAAMQGYCDEHGLVLRPHIKTHKLPEVARMQVDAGARGLTCQKLCEAEVMADAGFDDILISFPLVAEAKAERLAALVERLEGLRFAGLMTYPSLPETGPWLRSAREAIERAGLAVECVSVGGTPTARRTHEVDGATELRVGTYVYGDRACIANGS